MRHAIKGRKLNRTSSHRKSLFINLSSSLLKHERIKTTLPKAKDLRSYFEKIVTIGKKNTLANRRLVLSILNSQELVNKLFSDIASRVQGRNGGYTRIMRCGFRSGDKAPMAIIELVDKKLVDDIKKPVKKQKESKNKDTVDAKQVISKEKKKDTAEKKSLKEDAIKKAKKSTKKSKDSSES